MRMTAAARWRHGDKRIDRNHDALPPPHHEEDEHHESAAETAASEYVDHFVGEMEKEFIYKPADRDSADEDDDDDLIDLEHLPEDLRPYVDEIESFITNGT